MKEIKDITIGEVAKLVDWADVKKSLQYHYPHLAKVDNYQDCLKRIVSAKKKKPKKSNERIEIYANSASWGGKSDIESSYSIHTIELGTDMGDEWGEKTGQPKCWSMSFRPWDDLINLKVYDGTFEHYTLTDIVAHFIYEITWYGNEKQMKKQGKKLLGRVKEAKKDLKKRDKQQHG